MGQVNFWWPQFLYVSEECSPWVYFCPSHSPCASRANILPLETLYVKQNKAVFLAVPGMFLQEIQWRRRVQVTVELVTDVPPQTFPPFQIWKSEAQLYVGASQDQTQLLGAEDPQAVVSSLERSQVCPLDSAYNLVLLLPSSPSWDLLKWAGGERRRKGKI